MQDRYKELNYFSRPGELNNFSYWFPKIEKCGIKVPESVVVPVPLEVQEAFYMESNDDYRAVADFVADKVQTAAAKIQSPLLFIKNGGFSNKFDAGASCFCKSGYEDLLSHIITIQYQSLCMETGGEDEIVIRERIPYNSEVIPCIYSGLPLRPEFRAFYDFDLHKVLFMVNYWDYDYCRPHIFNATDKIIFDKMKTHLEKSFELCKEMVENAVAEAMKRVEGLSGPWSIDIMLDNYPTAVQADVIQDITATYSKPTEQYDMWLIDMAVAERSAYWDKRPGNV